MWILQFLEKTGLFFLYRYHLSHSVLCIYGAMVFGSGSSEIEIVIWTAYFSRIASRLFHIHSLLLLDYPFPLPSRSGIEGRGCDEGEMLDSSP